MLAAIITLSLLSLLVATEADPAGSSSEPAGDKQLRPSGGCCARKNRGKSDRMAA